MSIFRISKDKDNPYVMLDKRFLKDSNLSAKAKGILSFLLSLPDDWQIYESEIAKHFTDGITSINTGIKELIKFGYITRSQSRDKSGKFEPYEYCVTELPTVTRKTDSGKTYLGKAELGETYLGKTDTTNNDLPINDLPINNDNNIVPLPKRKKEKPILKNYADLVNMTEIEYNKLLTQYGDLKTKAMITKLDNYKGSSGKTYKSDYKAILSWVADEIMKQPTTYKGKESTFNNFEQRAYSDNDVSDLEKKLLGWKKE